MVRVLLASIFLALFFVSCQESGTTDTSYAGINKDSNTPDSFTFDNRYNAEINTLYTSNEIKVSGLETDTLALLSISEGTLIVDGDELTESQTYIGNDQTFAVKLESSSNYGITKTSTVTLGSFKTNFYVVTQEDTIADQFNLNDISDAELSTVYYSNTITVDGLGTGVTVEATVTNGSIIFNNTLLSDNMIYVANGDKIAIKLESNGNYLSTKEAKLTIGEVESTFSVTTYPNVTAVYLSPSSKTIEIGGTTAFTKTISPSNAPTGVFYQTSNSSVATVTSSGVVTGIGVGTATITATSTRNNTKSASSTVNVVTSLPVSTPTSITISPSTTVLQNNETKKLDALPYPSGDNADILWNSSDISVVTVDNKGNVTAVSPGTATITAYSNSDPTVSGSATVRVEIYEELNIAEELDTVGSVSSIAVDSNSTYIYISDSASGVKGYSLNLSEVNSTNISSSLTHLGTANLGAIIESIEIAHDDSALFVAKGYNGVGVLDITAPATSFLTAEIASYNTGYSSGNSFAKNLVASSDDSRVFIATQLGVEWLSYSGGALTLVDNYSLPVGISNNIDITSDSKIVIVAGGSGGVYFFDVLGSTFSLITTYVPSVVSCGSVTDIEISKDDKLLFLGCANGYIEAVDIEDLATISLVGTYTAPEKVESLKLSNDEERLYVSNGVMGVIVLDITFHNLTDQSIEPRAVSAFNTVGYVKNIGIAEIGSQKLLIVADGGNGILILQ